MAFTVEPGIYIAPSKATIDLSHAPYDPDEALRLTFDLGATAARAEMDRRRAEAGTFTHAVPAGFHGLGVRIEDDILITTTGHENLSELAPVDPDDIEALCGEATGLPTFG
jgi:Xaa-Pro aminopeptidase